jgi:tetratricopeptide (TPR) repeat protein
MSTPDEDAARYRHAEAAWRAGDAAAALAELEALVADAPAHPNAHNLAGWILRTALPQHPESLAHAIRHFAAAHLHEPHAGPPLCNLADALLAAGRDAEAVTTVQTAIERDPTDAHANNWLGWYRLVRGNDADAALVHLAIATRGWFGPAHVNQAMAYEAKGDLVAAEAAYAEALLCRDLHDPALVHARLAAFARERGELRPALSGFRRALWHEHQRKGARASELAVAAEAMEDALLQRGEYFPHGRDEAAWIAHAEAVRHVDGDDPRRGVPTAVELIAAIERATAMLASLADAPREPIAFALDAMREAIAAWMLPRRLAGVRIAIDPDAAQAEPVKRALAEVARGWTRAHRLLYVRLCEHEQTPGDDGVRSAIEQAIRSGDHDRALVQLEALAGHDLEGLLSCVGLCEAAGEDARLVGQSEWAHRYLRLALTAWQWHASGASSGGEGMARMLDVNRVRERLARV